MKKIWIGLFVGAAGCVLGLGQSTVTASEREQVLHSFGGGADGAYPLAAVLDAKGRLYGTTWVGGSSGAGTVFALDPKSGAETVLYSFGGANGAYPNAGLIDERGVLYGTTYQGGARDAGTLFAVDPANGTETVVYSFCAQQSCTDGQLPAASLIDVKGVLWATTSYGGAYGYGTVFALNPITGTETVIHSFGSGTDGQTPEAGLIDVKGTLYGTTEYGGSYGYGTVFSLDPNTMTEIVLYSFDNNGADAEYPTVGLINVNGTLYGTTQYGGARQDGTVFTLDPNTGAEAVVYSFCKRHHCSDGRYPESVLLQVNGVLYGTTYLGGANCVPSGGCGAAFSFNPMTGIEKVIYNFCEQTNCTDGVWPAAGLIDRNGTLYGTTFVGGTANGGTVFALKAS